MGKHVAMATRQVKKKRTRLPGILLCPPKIVVFNRIVAPQPSINYNMRRIIPLIAAAPQQPVTGHYPAPKKAMLFKSLDAVGGTGGKHGAPFAIQR